MLFEDTKNVNIALYLMRNAITGNECDSLPISSNDIPSIIEYGNKQQIAGLLAYGLELSGHGNVQLSSLRYSIVAKIMKFDIERKEIISELESCGIWYMPLKGIIMKDEYPHPGMRDMVDNDILIDANRRYDVRDIFIKRGYHYNEKMYGSGHDDAYYKCPIYNFEMHTFLGENGLDIPTLNNYYLNPSHLMKKDSGNKYGYHMDAEDFFIYLLAHSYKHYNYSGMGIRNLIDIYIYMKNHSNMNMEYIWQELDKMKIRSFAETMLSLSNKLFDTRTTMLNINNLMKSFNDAELHMFDIVVNAGAFGTTELNKFIQIKKIEQAQGSLDDIDIRASVSIVAKIKYYARRLFPRKSALAQRYEFCANHPHIYWLIHFQRIFRLFNLCIHKFRN